MLKNISSAVLPRTMAGASPSPFGGGATDLPVRPPSLEFLSCDPSCTAWCRMVIARQYHSGWSFHAPGSGSTPLVNRE